MKAGSNFLNANCTVSDELDGTAFSVNMRITGFTTEEQAREYCELLGKKYAEWQAESGNLVLDGTTRRHFPAA